jgi:hypothetical protein
MKIESTSKILCGILIAFLAFGVATAQAGIGNAAPPSFTGKSFGIAHGQTARLNFLNLSDREVLVVAGRFVDSDGTLLNEFHGTVAPSMTMSFDLDRDSIARETNRLQVHIEIDTPRPSTKLAVPSLEVFGNGDGVTDYADFELWKE